MFALSVLVVYLLALGQFCDALPSDTQSTLVRKEWRDLSKKQRLEYINAVKCMQSKPSRVNGYWEGAKAIFDDYQGLHISQTEYIHLCGQFLPWHRYFIWLWEQDLRKTCCYTGALPYWDWTRDSKDSTTLAKSPMWDSKYGFGGNGKYIADLSNFPPSWLFPGYEIPGRTGGGCVTTGPFADRNVSMGVGNTTAYTPHCLRRDFSGELFALTTNMTFVKEAMQSSNFWWLNRNVEQYGLNLDELRVHGGGHLGVGGQIGDMSNSYSSPGDPVFYLHHANLDRLWASWQKKKWPARKQDIGGPDKVYAYPFDFFGTKPYQNVTLETPLRYTPMAATIKIRETMDISSLGYTYDKFY